MNAVVEKQILPTLPPAMQLESIAAPDTVEFEVYEIDLSAIFEMLTLEDEDWLRVVL